MTIYRVNFNGDGSWSYGKKHLLVVSSGKCVSCITAFATFPKPSSFSLVTPCSHVILGHAARGWRDTRNQRDQRRKSIHRIPATIAERSQRQRYIQGNFKSPNVLSPEQSNESLQRLLREARGSVTFKVIIVHEVPKRFIPRTIHWIPAAIAERSQGQRYIQGNYCTLSTQTFYPPNNSSNP